MTSEEDFNNLLPYLSNEKFYPLHDENDYSTLDVWLAGSDAEVEGTYMTWYTKLPMPYLPWQDNRPYLGSEVYNYIQADLKFVLNDTGRYIKDFKIKDLMNHQSPYFISTVFY